MRYTDEAALLQAIQDSDVAILTPAQDEAPTEAQTERKRAQADNLRHKFETLWKQLGGPELEREYRFHDVRRHRFDYALPTLYVAIELDGGQFQNGRHQRAMGFQRDCEKMNLAILAGWKVFRISTAMVTPDHLLPIIDYIKR